MPYYWGSSASGNLAVITREPRNYTTDLDACCRDGNGVEIFDQNLCVPVPGTLHDSFPWAMGDGSVRWTSKYMDLNLLHAASTVAGGRVAKLP